MQPADPIKTFTRLGTFLMQFSDPDGKSDYGEPWLEELNKKFFGPLESMIRGSHIHNPWFTETNVRLSLGSIGKTLKSENLGSWLSRYGLPENKRDPKTIAVVMAGNIPLVGFHDILCVLLSGHNLLAKISVKDENLPKMISEIIVHLSNDFNERIRFTDGRINQFDAVIATGGDNTSRYFEYYFGKYPHIIRKNRNSAAILDGSETGRELEWLSDDVFRYFGLGCRNVSKLFIPNNYDLTLLLKSFEPYRYYADHNKWANNYEYQRALHLIDQVPHADNGFMIMREDSSPASPISVLNYERVNDTAEAFEIVHRQEETLQCVAGKTGLDESIIPFGRTQEPGLDDYADNIDTMEFLLNL